MNHESNDFSRWTWTPRTGASAAERAYAIEARRPSTSAKWADRVIAGLLVAFLVAIVFRVM